MVHSVASLLVATKFKDVQAPSLDDLIKPELANVDNVDVLRKAELQILSNLHWDVHCCSTIDIALSILHFLSQNWKGSPFDLVTLLLSSSDFQSRLRVLCLLCQVQGEMLLFSSADIALSCFLVCLESNVRIQTDRIAKISQNFNSTLGDARSSNASSMQIFPLEKSDQIVVKVINYLPKDLFSPKTPACFKLLRSRLSRSHQKE